MNKAEFKKWCNSKDSKLWKWPLGNFFSDFGIAFILGFVYLFVFVASSFIPSNSKIFIYIPEPLFYVIYIILLFFIFGVALSKLFSRFLVMNRAQYVACMLNKLSNDLSFHDNTNELKKRLKSLYRASKFQRNIDSSLFTSYNAIQDKFYTQLRELPKRIFHALNNGDIKKISLRNLEDLAYYIYADDDKKVKALDNITSSYPHVLDFKRNNNFSKIKTLLRKKSTLIILWFLLLLIAALGVHKRLGIDRNSTFLGFMGFFGVVAYIIFKK